jgi:transcriptional regulator with XRE-family HTH domain
MRDHNAFREAVAEEVRAAMARGRRGRRVSQTELAAYLEMGQSSLSRRLSGEYPFDVDELDRIAAYLNVPTTDLLFGGSRYGEGRAKGALLNTAGQAA